MQLDFEEIKKLIPQRFPYIMIDKVLEVEPGKQAVAIKNVSGNDIFFLGHFPDRAIMPGTAIIEAMAQTAIILFATFNENENNPPSPPFSKVGLGGFSVEKADKKPIYFLGSVKARFLRPVVPGDQLKIKVVNVRSMPKVAYVSAEAFVDDKKVSEAEIVFSERDE